MARAFHIAVDADLPRNPDRLLSPVSCLLFSVICLFTLSGCPKPDEETPIWETVKIGDLAPYEGTKPLPQPALKAVNLDVYIFEVPAANVHKLDRIRKSFYIRPLRLRSYPSFEADSFQVRFGQGERWREIQDIVQAAGGQRAANVSLMLPDAMPETVAIAGLDRPQSVFFTSSDGVKQAANIGPGVLGLRVQAETIPDAKGQCSVSAYPVFSPPTHRAVPQLNLRAKLREFPFTTAAFGLTMAPGDFVYLGPKEYLTDQTTLGGLFFSNPRGSLFFGKTEAAEFKPCTRIFLLFCTGINY
jgi:hypothetical protein